MSCVNALSERCSWKSGVDEGCHLGAGVRAAAFPRRRWRRPARPARKTGTKITFKPDSTIMDATEVQLRHSRAAAARAGVSEQGPEDHADRRARGPGARSTSSTISGGIAEFIKHLNTRQERAARQADLLRRRARSAQRRHAHHGSGAAVQRRLLAKRVQLRQQHQHRRRRHAPERLPQRADPHHQRRRARRRACSRTSRRT